MNFYLPIIAGLIFSIFTSSFASIQTNMSTQSYQKKLAALEASSGGRIGIYAIDTANGLRIQYRANERFPMGCTSKVIGVAAVLKKSMNDPSLLSQKITYSKNDLSNWSPITEQHLSSGMTIQQLCDASIRYSDNTAMNLLVKQLGGLQSMNLFARSIHNTSFRQDNGWPKEALSGGKGNLQDSSTPKAMTKSLQNLVFTNTLAAPQRNLLISWLKGNTTGGFRIRAGVPKDWIVADKTGSGAIYGTTNDIGVIWPPQCAPIILSIFYTNNDKNAANREDIVASVTRLLVDTFAQNDACLKR